MEDKRTVQAMYASKWYCIIIKQRLPLINEEVAKILANIVDFEILFENNDKKLEIFIKTPTI